MLSASSSSKARAMELRDRTCEILRDLIAFPTLSSDSNQALIAYAAGLLEDCGAQVELTSSPCGAKANLFATLGQRWTAASYFRGIVMWCQ